MIFGERVQFNSATGRNAKSAVVPFRRFVIAK
jgi:hypothetical protein